MRRLVVPNSFFAEAAEVLRSGQPVKLHVDGRSMYPFIHGGRDFILVEPYRPEEELPRFCCPFYQWQGTYMIHRYIGQTEDGRCRMLGDGNIARIEEVRREEIIGLLRTIYRPDGTEQDCRDPRWLRKARWWYWLKPVRRFLIPLLMRLER